MYGKLIIYRNFIKMPPYHISSEKHKYHHHIWRWCTEAVQYMDQHTLSRLNSVVECAAVVRLVREKLPVHFCAGTAMSPVRVWEAGPETLPRIENLQREHLYIEKTFKVCSQRGQKTTAKETEVSG